MFKNCYVVMVLAVGMLALTGCIDEIFPSAKRQENPERIPGQVERDPNPVLKPQMGFSYSPRNWITNTYHPGETSRMITAQGFKAMTQQTFAERGGDFSVHLSPDGERLYFNTTRYTSNPQVCHQGIEGKAVTLVTDDKMVDMMPKVSPDGKEIAWCSNRHGKFDILVRSAEVGPEKGATQLTRASDDDIHPTWSPPETVEKGKSASRLIAFSRFNSMDGVWQIWVMNYHTRTLSNITEGLFPEFCPIIKKTDSATGDPVYTLAYQRARQRGVPFYSIWTIDVKMGSRGAVESVGSPVEIVASDKWAAINPAWSPDGEHLVFATVRKSVLSQFQARIYKADDIYVVSLNGTDLTQVTSHAAPDWDPWWARDPSDPKGPGRIYFTSERMGVANIWSVKPLIPGLLASRMRAPVVNKGGER